MTVFKITAGPEAEHLLGCEPVLKIAALGAATFDPEQIGGVLDLHLGRLSDGGGFGGSTGSHGLGLLRAHPTGSGFPQLRTDWPIIGIFCVRVVWFFIRTAGRKLGAYPGNACGQ